MLLDAGRGCAHDDHLTTRTTDDTTDTTGARRARPLDRRDRRRLLQPAPEPVAEHAVLTGHLGVRKGVADVPMYRDNKFIAEMTAMLAYTNTLPNHPSWGKYRDIVYQSIQAVEVEGMTPDAALDWLLDQMTTNLGDELTVID